MTYLGILSEKTLLSLIALGIAGRRVVIIDVEPVFPFSGRFLRLAFSLMVKIGLATDGDAGLTADEVRFSTIWWYRYPDMFQVLEPAGAKYYGFDQLEQKFSKPYVLACKHDAAKQMDYCLRRVTRLKFFTERLADAELSIWGIGADTLHWYQEYFGVAPGTAKTRMVRPSLITNMLTAMVIVAFAIGWSLSRFRPGRPTQEPAHLGVDLLQNRNAVQLIQNLVNDPRDLLVFLRQPHHRQFLENEGATGIVRVCDRTGGIVTVPILRDLIFTAVPEIFRIAGFSKRLPGELAKNLMKLPMQRVMIRALLTRYPVKCFLSFDDYNAEHIIRTDELRKQGALSLGMNHGLPVPETVSAMWRYLDYDVYYAFGDQLYRKYYADTWAAGMRVKPVGSFGMDSSRRARLNDDRPGDIVLFGSTMPGYQEFYDWAIRLAHHFPDRTIYMKHKRSNDGLLYKGLSSDLPAEFPDNLVNTAENAYELMLKSRYAVSTPNSTVAAEAVQFGSITFVWDATEFLSKSYYREFPDLCLKTVDEFIDRIEAIEAGRWHYPRDLYSGLIDLSGQDILETLSSDMGLPLQYQPSA